MIKNNSMLLARALRCPVCGAAMQQAADVGAGQLYCCGARRHCYDFSRSGHVHLAPRHSGGGDSREAVRARTAFLSAGYYDCAATALAEAVASRVASGIVVDAGCGEGYYTNRVRSACADGVEVCGFDLSRDAAEAGAKAAKREGLDTLFAVASVFELPLSDGSVDAVTSVFAPCAEEETLRVLKPGGFLVLVGAGERHLLGLKRALYEDTYENAGRADLPQHMTLQEAYTVEREIEVVGEQQIANLFSMTPYYWRTSRADAEKLRGLERLTTTVAFDFKIYGKSE